MNNKRKLPDCYAARLINMDEVSRSRSGGLFISLCNYVISNHGVVYGCSCYSPHSIRHERATTIEQCEVFRNSKYVQSKIGETYKQCNDDLNSGLVVLYSGTGCQIHGLLSYLNLCKTDTKKLITVDLVCHGVPSPRIWDTYIKQVEIKKRKRITSVNFRDKETLGWKAHKERIYFDDGTSILGDVWTNLFYSNRILRPVCLECPYATVIRCSDFTLGDYWGIENNASIFDDDKGVSLLLVHSEKGRKIFGELVDITYVKTNICNSLQTNLLHPSYVDKEKRNKTMRDYVLLSNRKFVKKYLCKYSFFYVASKINHKIRRIKGK